MKITPCRGKNPNPKSENKKDLETKHWAEQVETRGRLVFKIKQQFTRQRRHETTRLAPLLGRDNLRFPLFLKTQVPNWNMFSILAYQSANIEWKWSNIGRMKGLNVDDEMKSVMLKLSW